MTSKPVLRVVNSDGSLGGVLPHYANLQIAWDDGDVSTIQFDYPSDQPGASLLGDQVRIAVLLGGVRMPETFLLDDANADEIKQANADTWAGTGGLQQLDWAIVYPAGFPAIPASDTGQAGDGYSGDTPGKALRYLLELAQGRGTLASMTWDFTDTVDSAGVAWPATVTDFWPMGTSLLDVVRAWYTRQVAVARWNGATNKLQLFAWGNQGADRTQTVVLQRGVDVLDGANEKSSRATRSVVMVASDTVAVERTSAPALSAYQRREGFVSQTGVSDTTVLDSIGDSTLQLTARQLQAYTYTLAMTRRMPMVDYFPGDKVTIRGRTGSSAKNIRQLTIAWNGDSGVTATGGFGDRFLDMDDLVQAQLDLLTGGSIQAGYGTPVVAGTIPTDTSSSGGGTTDTLSPAPPTSLAGSSVVVYNQQAEYATLVLTWTAPITNSDGTTLDDLGGYDVQYQVSGATGWTPAASVGKDATGSSIQGLYPGTTYNVRVRAKDIWSNVSTWVSSSFTTTTDSTPPTQTPSTPSVVTFLYNGLQVSWDGKSSTAGAMDNDTRYVEVHVSTTSGFTPSSTTLKDYLAAGGGVTVVAQLTAGTVYYVRFRVVDWAGNIGPTSAQASATPVQVGNSNLASGSVGTSQLQSLAVTDAQIATLSATKITAGTLSAVVTLSGTFQTAASGARVVVNSAGINLYNAAGNATVTMNSSDGSATFTGNLATCNVSGTVKAFSATSGAYILLSASQFGVPAMNMSTGHVIEKYPAWVFTTTNDPLKYLITYINAPGSQLAGSATGTGYFYTGMQMISEVIDGDYANATTLPTTMSGRVVFDFPSGAYHPGSQIMGQSSVALRGHYANFSNDYSLMPAVVIRDSADTNGSNYHEIAMRVENTGSPFNAQGTSQCELAIVTNDGSDYANLRAWDIYSQGSIIGASGADTKTDVHDLPYSAVDVISANPAKRWRRGDSSDEHYVVGPMADDMHEDVRRRSRHHKNGHGFGNDLTSMVGLLWAAIAELDTRLKELKQ